MLSSDDPAPQAAPAMLARFALRERLGEGGMGQVWLARDPELDRDVAVKVLRPEVVTSERLATEARARLKREAQAMARLAHPNVIAVHEVGDVDNHVFVVMELVKGGTLRQWLAARARRVDAILDVFLQAGRGLAAAHAAGLVHRDFKPENVLVGDDGRARVTDFGLVGVGERVREPGPEPELPLSLTRTGAVLGTPAYLAPEVLRGGAATEQSDQFSFCVGLYEALWRQPPFPGETIQALFASVTAGAITPPPRRPPVPARVRKAILRGLASDPAARWPSMQALLDVLTTRRSRWLAVAAIGTGLAAIAAIAVVIPTGDEDPAGTTPSALPAPPPLPSPDPVQLTRLGGCNDSPSFVDDDTIVFEHYTGKQGDLFRIASTGGPPVQLNTPERSYESPTASARGEVLAIRAHADGLRTLERVRVDGNTTPVGAMPKKASDSGAVLSGETLYYLRSDNAQVRRRRDGVDEEVAHLPADRRALSLAVSPDERWLLIATSRTVGQCVIDLAAKPAVVRCETDPNRRGRPMLLGDSQHYLSGGADGLWRRRLDGREAPVRVLSEGIEGLSMTASADGRAIVYSACVQRTRLRVLATDGGVRDVMDGRHQDLAARGDGTLAMVRYVGIEESLLAVREPSGALRELTPRGQLVREPSWSIDGRRVAYRVAGVGGGIYIVDVSPYPPRRISAASTDISPVFLADGRVVVARYEPDQVSRLWLLDPETGLEKRVDERPTWPYDRDPVSGRILVGDLYRHRLWLWDPATGTETAVAHGDRGAAAQASVARDGQSVLAVWGRELWRLPIGGGAPTLLFRASEDVADLGRAVELPDGTIAFTEYYRAGELFRITLAP